MVNNNLIHSTSLSLFLLTRVNQLLTDNFETLFFMEGPRLWPRCYLVFEVAGHQCNILAMVLQFLCPIATILVQDVAENTRQTLVI